MRIKQTSIFWLCSRKRGGGEGGVLHFTYSHILDADKYLWFFTEEECVDGGEKAVGGKPSGVVQHGHRLAQVSQHVLRLKVVRHDVILQNQPSEVIKSNKQGCGSGSACNFSPGWKTEKRNENC